MRTTLHLKLLLYTISLFLIVSTCAQKSVLTQHNDLNRTGWYDKETTLNKNNVRPGSFGKLFARDVDDQVYAQPLVKLKLNLPEKGIKNIVFIATVNNTVYAFDADSANVSTPYWQANLTEPNSRPVRNTDMTDACGGFYRDFSGNMGIVGTPVIDSTTNTMYVVARNVNENNHVYTQYLHALDIVTGTEKANSPVLITATINASGDGSVNGQLTFDAQKQNQRPGLLLLNGIVYIAWSSHCDWGPYHGWIIGYDKTALQQKYVYNATPDGYNGGIWMSGAAPSADEEGNIYVAIGNGSVGYNGDVSDLTNRGESALKLTPSGSTLSVSSFFTPLNYPDLEAADLDFGVTEMMLIPNTNLVMTACKDGHIYVMDRDNMGSYNPTANQVHQTFDLGTDAHLRSSFAYYKGEQKEFAYSWSENALLKAFPFDRTNNLFDSANVVNSGVQGPIGNSGAMLSVSSNGSADSTAILWATHAVNCDANQSVCPGILRAFDANNVDQELWNSGVYPEDNPGRYAKFVCPTIANGKVYLATFANKLIVYGLTDNKPDSCSSTNVALNKTAHASSIENTNYVANYVTDGSLSTRWSSQFSDPQYIYIDLGARYDMCRVVLHWEAALGKDFKIQVSEDSINWTTVANIKGNSSPDNSIPLKASGRYVRMYGTQRALAYGYSIREFEVYGTQSNTSCATPANLPTTDIYESSATLHWTGVNAVKYIVQYKTVAAGSWLQAMTTDNKITLNGLACGTSYLYCMHAICDKDTSEISTSAAFSTLACNSNCNPLPTRWSTLDIGDVGVAGSACFDNNVFQLKGSGTDIWDIQDEFRFAYKTLVGDGEIVARVIDQDASNQWNKTGIMVRESLTGGSRHAFVALTSSNGVAFQYRTTTDGYSNNYNTGPGITAPYWIKLMIAGTIYTAYMSPDGITWTQVGSPVDAGFGGGKPVYAGLAITSHDNTMLSAAHIDNFVLSGVLPVQLFSFTASPRLDQTVSLQWIATRESNTKKFIVERGDEHLHFYDLDTIDVVNNGRLTITYQQVDYHPVKGTNYYRLRMMEADGTVNYSPVVVVHIDKSGAPQMHPNPASGMVHIMAGTDPVGMINIYDVTGKMMKSIKNKLNSIDIPVATLNNGVYFVEIRTSTAVYREKLIVHN